MVAVPDAANRPFFAPRPDVEEEDAVSVAEDAALAIAAVADLPEADSATEAAEVALATVVAVVLPAADINALLTSLLSFFDQTYYIIHRYVVGDETGGFVIAFHLDASVLRLGASSASSAALGQILVKIR